jgi:predicted ATPase
MLALYRADRQAEALQVYHDTRRLLVDELGIEPSRALRELEKAILTQDSGLALSARAERAPTNLPSPPTPLIGRERELAELLELVSRARLVTLTGPGGTGKTRLALEAAAELVEAYPDGVWWVPLAALRDPALVEPMIAQALGAKDSLTEHLDGKRTLLLLDNFEQLVEAAPRLSELLAGTEQVTIIVTSREPLHVGGEHQYPVPPLPEKEAVDLFIERARSVHPGFEPDWHVAEICRRLDGLPLAIELAAARVKVLAPAALLERLEHPLPVLTGGSRDAPERQRTLDATIAWSHELLSEQEQALFRRLAVFAGGFTLEAAEKLCAADLDSLHSLVDKSLVRHRGDRFGMLETIREYAYGQLEESGELARLQRPHFDFFLALAEEAKNDLERGLRAIWLTRLELEHDNCRAALRWARERGEPRLELRLAAALSRFWYARSHWDEGRRRVAGALARDPEAPAGLRGHALRWAALMAYRQGDLGAARALAEEAAAGHRATGDIGGLASAVNMLGVVALGERKHQEARALFEESNSMRDELGDEFQIQSLPYNVGLLALDQGQYDEARRQLEAVLALARKHEQEEQVAESLCDLGFAALGQSRHDEAQELLEEALRMSVESGWKENVDFCLVGLAGVSAAAEELERAARLLGAAEALAEEIHLRLEPYAESTRARTADELASRLGNDRFAVCLAEGRSLPLSEAVSLALADGD